MEVHEVFPAVQAAEKAVTSDPRWWVAYQTLGRAQLGLGDLKLVRSTTLFMFINIKNGCL